MTCSIIGTNLTHKYGKIITKLCMHIFCLILLKYIIRRRVIQCRRSEFNLYMYLNYELTFAWYHDVNHSWHICIYIRFRYCCLKNRCFYHTVKSNSASDFEQIFWGSQQLVYLDLFQCFQNAINMMCMRVNFKGVCDWHCSSELIKNSNCLTFMQMITNEVYSTWKVTQTLNTWPFQTCMLCFLR